MASCIYSACSSIGSCIAYVLCCKCCSTRSAPVAPEPSHSQSQEGNPNRSSPESTPRARNEAAIVDKFCRYLADSANLQNSVPFDRAVQYLNQIEQSPQDELALLVDATKGRILGFNNRLAETLGEEDDDDFLQLSIMNLVFFKYGQARCSDWEDVVGRYVGGLEQGTKFPFNINLHHLYRKKAFHITLKHLDSQSEAMDRKQRDGQVEIAVDGARKTEDFVRKFPYFLITFHPQLVGVSQRSIQEDGTMALQCSPNPNRRASESPSHSAADVSSLNDSAGATAEEA